MKKFIPLLALISMAIRLVWHLYTGYIYEDAFITFRYARNLSNGLGFVYNAGEHIYGTTTPLLALVLAILGGKNIPLASVLIGMMASLITVTFLIKFMSENWFKKNAGLLIALLVITSDKIIVRDMGGMETPIVLLLMTSTLYFASKGRQWTSGLLGGLLLFTRVDSIIWVVLIGIGFWIFEKKIPIRYGLACAVIYLPWLIFVQIYFGSVIPYTITAKLHAYYDSWGVSGATQLKNIILFMTPFSLPSQTPSQLPLIAGYISISVAALGAVSFKGRRWLYILPVFFVEEVFRLILTKETFEARYYMPAFFVFLIIFGSGLWVLVANIRFRYVLAIATFFACIGYEEQAQAARAVQKYLHDESRKEMGEWIRENTPQNASIFLEPLGYVGYYADRYMIDEVGLVTPAVVEFEKDYGKNTFLQIYVFRPDYLVLHCDDGMRAKEKPEVAMLDYEMVKEFNPLQFDWKNPSGGLARTSCYQIWGRIPGR